MEHNFEQTKCQSKFMKEKKCLLDCFGWTFLENQIKYWIKEFKEEYNE